METSNQMADMGVIVLQVCLLLPAYLNTVQSVTYLVMFLLVQFAHIDIELLFVG